MNRGRLKLFVLGAIVLMVAVVILLQQDPTAQHATSGAAKDVITQEELAGLIAAAELGVEGTQADLERVEIATSETSDAVPEGEWILVHVLNAQTEKPIFGASVWTFTPQGSKPELSYARLAARERDWEKLAQALSQEFISNAKGEVLLPYLGRDQAAVARKGELYGFAGAFYQDKKVLSLSLDTTLEVAVINQAGTPLVGVPIGLVRHNSSGRQFPQRSFSALSDADGIARIRHAQILKNYARPEDLYIQPLVLLKEVIRLPLTDFWESENTPTLVLPPMGSLEVTVFGYDGKPVHALSDAYLFADPAPGEPWHMKSFRPRESPTGVATSFLDEGTVRYSHVGLNLDLAVWILFADSQMSTFAFGRSPWQEGQLVKLEARPTKDRYQLKLRVVKESGSPLGDAQLKMVMRNEPYYEEPTSTDADGNLLFTIPGNIRSFLNRKGEHWFEVRHAKPTSGKPTMERFLLPKLHPGINDLGRIQLRPDYLLMSGRVENEQGRPIPQVWLGLSGLAVDQEVMMDRGYSVTDKDGYFIFFGKPQGSSVTLKVHTRQHLAFNEDFSVGAYDETIVLREGKQLSGSAILPDGYKANDFLVEYLDEYGESVGIMERLQNDGSFLLEGLPNGTGSLHFLLIQTRSDIAVVEKVQPVGPDERQDPRLEAVDLRGLIFELSVCVVDSLGNPLKHAVVQSQDPRILQQQVSADEDGCVTFPSPTASMEVVIVERNSLPKLVTLHQGGQRVELQAGISTTLQLPGPLELPTGITLKGYLIADAPFVHVKVYSEGIRFDAQGLASTVLPGPGEYQVSLYLTKVGVHPERYLPSWRRRESDIRLSVMEDSSSNPLLLPVDMLEVETLAEELSSQ